MTRYVASAHVSTELGDRYVRQLAKHWAHNMTVEETAEHIRVIFPRDARGADWPENAVVTFRPMASEIACVIEASDPRQRDGLKAAISQHLDRFAFREAPLAFEWRDS